MQCTMRSRIIVQCTMKRVSSGCCFILKTDAPEIDILYDDTRSLTGKPSHSLCLCIVWRRPGLLKNWRS